MEHEPFTASLPTFSQRAGDSAHPETRCFCTEGCELVWSRAMPARPPVPNGRETCIRCNAPLPPRAACYHYMQMAPTASRNYLGFGAYVHEVYAGWYIVAVPAEHARWQAQRLQSGLNGGWQVFTTLADARAWSALYPAQHGV